MKNIEILKEIIKNKKPNSPKTINKDAVINPPVPKRSGIDIVEIIKEQYERLFKS
jgi:hypothetical protein